jgi:hypothetical protein
MMLMIIMMRTNRTLMIQIERMRARIRADGMLGAYDENE